MASKLNYHSSYEDIGRSLTETLEEIKLIGQTKQLKFDMLLKYGRILLMSGDLDKAYMALQQCSTHAIDNGIPEIKELYFWTSRILEEQGKRDKALKSYLMLLERESFIKDDEEFVNAILDRLITFGNIDTLVAEFKIKSEEKLINPTDLLGKVIKILRESN